MKLLKRLRMVLWIILCLCVPALTALVLSAASL